VTGGRDIGPAVNRLLGLPFVYKVATQDWHPPDHISFAANHPGAKPFESFATVVNPFNDKESYETRLWPVHCVQDTPGAELVPELDVAKVDEVVKKGTDKRVEMYSALYDPFEKPRVADSGLVGRLRERGVTDVYVVGLAADYCVWNTARDCAREGFGTVVVEEGTRAVDGDKWEAEGRAELEKTRVRVVSVDGPEVARVEELGR
jgi:nicotinamidase-related amidase